MIATTTASDYCHRRFRNRGLRITDVERESTMGGGWIAVRCANSRTKSTTCCRCSGLVNHSAQNCDRGHRSHCSLKLSTPDQLEKKESELPASGANPGVPAHKPEKERRDHAFGKVTPVCPWYLPPRSLYEVSQTSSLSKNSTCAHPSPA